MARAKTQTGPLQGVPNLPEQPSPSESANRLDDFDLWLRRAVINAFVIGSIANLIVTHLRTPYFDRTTLLPDALATIGLFSAWVIARLPWQRYGRDLFAIVLLYSGFLCAGLTYVTGGADSPFAPAYILLVFAAGLYYHPARIALFIVICCTALGFSPLLYTAPTSEFLVRQKLLSCGIAAIFWFQRLVIPELLRRARAEQQLQDDLRETRLLSDELARVNTQLAQEAQTDALTGLPNHGAIVGQADTAVARTIRDGAPLSFIFFDLDHFKWINDTYGHSVGDLVLSRVGSCASAVLRTTDMIGRYGGEEFLVTLPETDLLEAQHVAERLLLAMRGSAIPLSDGSVLRITVSIGVASCSGGACSRQALLNAADEALYEAKRGGRDRICVAPAVAHSRDDAAGVSVAD